MAGELGATCADKSAPNDVGGKAAQMEDLAKITAERDALAKSFSDLASKFDDVLERVKKVEALPLARKTAGSIHAVSKEEDAAAVGATRTARADLTVEDVQKALAGMPEDERVMILTKAALANPRQITTAR